MNLKAINLNAVSTLTAFDKRPKFYWKFFHGNIKVMNASQLFMGYGRSESMELLSNHIEILKPDFFRNLRVVDLATCSMS